MARLKLMTKVLVAASLALLPACSNLSGPNQLGAQLTESYKLPAVYQDHRDQQQFFQTDQGRIAYTDHGQGKAIVLLHGVPTSSWMYRKTIAGLSKSMRVITVDQLGYGSSEKPKNDGDIYTARAQGERIRALLKSKGINSYSILMHDMGGLVAWEMLDAAPQEIENLVVLNTVVDKEGFNHPDMEAGAMTRVVMDAFSSSLTSSAILGKTFGDLGLKGGYELSEDECYGYVRPMREGGDTALYEFFTGINSDLFTRLREQQSRWPDFQGDVMVMWGAKDETLTTDQIPRLQSAFSIPQSQINVYDNNAHFIAEELPLELVAKVSDFVNN